MIAKRYAARSVLSLLLVTIFVSSCTAIPTFIWGPTITPTATPRVCPKDYELEIGEELETSPTLFVFVIDQGSVANGDGLEYKNGEVTFDLVEFINKITPEMSGPGDQYSLFEFGYYDYSIARLSGFESRLPSSPPRPETPVPFVTYTPLPTPDVSKLLDLDKLRARNEYAYNLSIQQQENESKAFEEQCNKTVVGTQIAATNTVWEVTKAAEISQIAKQLEEDIGLNEPEERPAPIPWQEVYYGLMHAATDLDYLCTRPASKNMRSAF